MTPRAEKLASPDFLWPFIVRLHRHANLLSLLFVAFGIAAWWTWAEAGRRPRLKPNPSAPHMAWLAGVPADAAGAWRSDVRAFSSPVLFALPTPLGFSRGALSEPGFAPPPGITTTNPLLLELPAPTSLVAQIARTAPGEAAAAARLLARPQDGEPAGPAGPAGRTSSALVVVWQRPGAAAETRIMPVAVGSVWTDSPSWEAVARIDLDPRGWAERVLLEKSSAVTNRNAAVVQLLRTMNFGAAGPRTGRAAVRYEGAAPAAAAPPNGGARHAAPPEAAP